MVWNVQTTVDGQTNQTPDAWAGPPEFPCYCFMSPGQSSGKILRALYFVHSQPRLEGTDNIEIWWWGVINVCKGLNILSSYSQKNAGGHGLFSSEICFFRSFLNSSLTGSTPDVSIPVYQHTPCLLFVESLNRPGLSIAVSNSNFDMRGKQTFTLPSFACFFSSWSFLMDDFSPSISLRRSCRVYPSWDDTGEGLKTPPEN